MKLQLLLVIFCCSFFKQQHIQLNPLSYRRSEPSKLQDRQPPPPCLLVHTEVQLLFSNAAMKWGIFMQKLCPAGLSTFKAAQLFWGERTAFVLTPSHTPQQQEKGREQGFETVMTLLRGEMLRKQSSFFQPLHFLRGRWNKRRPLTARYRAEL